MFTQTETSPWEEAPRDGDCDGDGPTLADTGTLIPPTPADTPADTPPAPADAEVPADTALPTEAPTLTDMPGDAGSEPKPDPEPGGVPEPGPLAPDSDPVPPAPEPGDHATRIRESMLEAPGPALPARSGPVTLGTAPGPEPPAPGPLFTGTPPEPAAPGWGIIRTDTEASTNSTMRQPIAAVGRMLPAGCSRITAPVYRNATRTRSATRATAS